MKKVYTGYCENYKKDNIINLNDSECELSKTLSFSDSEYNKLYNVNSEMNEVIKAIICTNLYYNKVLKNIDPNELLDKLDNMVIVSDKRNMEFDYRHLIAFYLELLLGIETSEIKLNEDGMIEQTTRPEYLKRILEKTMYPDKKINDNNILTYRRN